MLLGHQDLPGRAAYDDFLREIVMPRNRRNAGAFRLQRQERIALPPWAFTDRAQPEPTVGNGSPNPCYKFELYRPTNTALRR